MNEIKQTMDEVKNFMWDLREGMGVPVIRRRISQLKSGLLGQQKEGNSEQTPPLTEGQSVTRERRDNTSFNSINSPNICGNSDDVALPSLTHQTTIQNRFAGGTLMPIRTSISNLLQSTGEVNRLKAEAELIEKEKELEKLEQEKKKSETGFHLRKGGFY